jgi:hypothetical protein
MLTMKVVPEPERGRRRERRIEQPVGYIEEPRPECQRSRQSQRKPEMGGKAKCPAPQRGHGRCVEAEQVPVLQCLLEESRHLPV